MNEHADAEIAGDLDVFSRLFGQLNVESILPLGNGLAFLALLLAAILIAISIVRGGTTPGTSQLIKRFCSVAVFFVLVTITLDVARFIFPPSPPPSEVALRISPVSIQEIDEKFPIYVAHNGTEQDIFTSPYETKLQSSQNYVLINANVVAGRLERRARQVTELLKNLEERVVDAAAPAASPPGLPPAPVPSSPQIDLGGG